MDEMRNFTLLAEPSGGFDHHTAGGGLATLADGDRSLDSNVVTGLTITLYSLRRLF